MKKIILLCILTLCMLNIHAQPVITITVNGSANTPITVCNAALLTASGCSGCTLYQWKLNGANVGSNSSNYYTTQPGTYTCVATNASGTSTSNAIMINVTVSTVSISAGGPVTFCNNPQQVTLTATNGGGYTYQWYNRTNGYSLIINGATSQTYQPPVNANEVYKVNASKQGCTSASNEITVSYFTAPPPPQTLLVFQNQTWICPNGGSPSIYITSTTGYSYQWKLNGNPVNTNCSGSSCIGPNAPGTYSCDISNACGTISSSNSVNITQPPFPVMAITAGNPTACTGSVQFSITNAALLPAGTAYQWKKSGASIAGATNYQYTASSAGSYTCYISIPGCTYITPAAVTIYTNPNIMTSDPVTFCSGAAAITANPPGATYQWKKNGVNISGATNQTYSATVTGGYTCVITPPGCTSSTSNSLSITSGVSNPIITAPNGYNDCNGGTVTLTVTNTNGATYQWGVQTWDIPGETSSSFNALQTGEYYCRVTESCGTTTVYSPIVGILPDESMYISGNVSQGNVCGSATLSLHSNNGLIPYTFQWYKDSAAISGADFPSYLANQPGTYNCEVSIPGCNTSYFAGYPFSSSFTITNIVTPLTPNPVLTPVSTTSLCTGHSVTLSVPACTGCSYKFYRKAISSWELAYDDSNAYVLTPYYPYTYYFYANVANACNNVNSQTDTIIAVQTFTTTVSPAGPFTFCSPGSVVLTATANTGTGYTYQWSKSFIPIAGATSSSYTATQTGYYTCVMTNASGCIANSNGVNITAYASVPSPTATALGSTTFCSGGQVGLQGNAPNSQTWQWKKNGIAIAGATSGYYVATASGTYTWVATNSCGSATSSPVIVTVHTLPSAVITAGGPTTFCSGGSVVLNAPGGANKTYQWLKDGNAIAGATSSTYIAAAAGTYKVTVTNTVNGCSKTTTAGTVVTVNPNPAATITPQGATTFCAGGSVVLKANTGTGLTYKWKKNNNFISGATLLNYTATTAGTYRVEVTKSNGCTKLSAGVAVTVPCKEEEAMQSVNNFDFNVYPNPNNGEFTIDFSNKLIAPVQIELTDAIGKVVKRFETSDKTIVIEEANLSKGIYCLTARNNNEVVIKKISIVK